MSIGDRSGLLVHWTGKSIELDPSALDDAKRRTYVDLLASILSKGFRLAGSLEVVSYRAHQTSQTPGHGNTRSWRPRVVCFTEVRITQASEHARKYGLLGLAFGRDFVLRHHGGPVHYVRGRGDDVVSEHLGALSNWFDRQRKNHSSGSSEEQELLQSWYDVVDLMCLTKPMSNVKGQEDFSLLHEHEWRIVQNRRLEHDVQLGTDGDYQTLSFGPGDVRMLVFPDSDTKRLALANSEILKFISASDPVVLTLGEIEQF